MQRLLKNLNFSIFSKTGIFSFHLRQFMEIGVLYGMAAKVPLNFSARGR